MHDLLTPHQNAVVSLYARGATYKEIAAELGISLGTVRCHLMNAAVRLGVETGGLRPLWYGDTPYHAPRRREP